MHQTQSLVNGSLSDAIAALAKRSVAIRHGAPRMTKEALDRTAVLQQATGLHKEGGLGSFVAGSAIGKTLRHSGALQSATDYFKNMNPVHQKALLGAGVGGVLGYGSSFLQDKEKRHSGSSALTGALAGGAAGLGLGLAAQNSPIAPPSASATPGGGSGGVTGGRPKLPPGQFYHPATGQVMAIDKNMPPEVAARLTNLDAVASNASVPQQITLGGLGGVGAAARSMPITTAASAGVGGYHAATLGKHLNISADQSRNLSHLRDGLLHAPDQVGARIGLSSDEGSALGRLARNKTDLNRVATKGGPYTVVVDGKPVTLSEEVLGHYRSHGANMQLSETARKAGKSAVLRESLFNRVTGLGNKHVNLGTSGGKLRTALKYLGLPAAAGVAELGGWDTLKQRSAGEEIQQLLQQHAKPVSQ